MKRQAGSSFWPTRMLLATPALLILLHSGCANHPVNVDMTGDIKACGTIKTVLAEDNNAQRVRSRTLPGQPRCLPKTALIDVDGLLVNRNLSGSGSLGENPVALFHEKLDAAAADPQVCSIVVRINSPGGGVTASDIMRRDLVKFRQMTGKPVVVCLMDLGAGGAYYLATASDAIVAHPTTLTGGLGVILNTYDLTQAMDSQKVYGEFIRSGSKIDIGSPAREMAEDDRAILERIATEYHDRMKRTVLASRGSLSISLPEIVEPAGEEEADDSDDDANDSKDDDYFEELDEEPEEIDPNDGTIFDGRVMVATQAMQMGMIDQLGYLDDAIATANGLAGIADSKVVVYKRCNDRALTAYDITPNLPASTVSLPISIPGLDRSQLPVFLYLWQPETGIERTGGI